MIALAKLTRSSLFLSLVLLASCRTIETRVQDSSGERLREPASYAWVDEAPAPEVFDASWHDGARIEDPALSSQVRAAVEAELAARGLHPCPPEQAELLLLERAGVHVRFERRDPYFTGSESARFEEGTLSLSVFDAASGERLWHSTATSRLRDVAEGYGLYTLRYLETGSPRDWKVRDKVAALLERFPLRPLR